MLKKKNLCILGELVNNDSRSRMADETLFYLGREIVEPGEGWEPQAKGGVCSQGC